MLGSFQDLARLCCADYSTRVAILYSLRAFAPYTLHLTISTDRSGISANRKGWHAVKIEMRRLSGELPLSGRSRRRHPIRIESRLLWRILYTTHTLDMENELLYYCEIVSC